MFGNKEDLKQDTKNCDFIMVCDKQTKPAAYSLKNALGNRYQCVVWEDKHYRANEATLSNRNNIVILNKSVLEEQLANPALKSVSFVPGIDMIVEGNVIGLRYNPDTAPANLKQILKENWGKFLVATVGPIAIIGGVPGAILAYTLLLNSKKKKIRYACFFDAINKLKEEGIEKYFNE